MGIGRCNKEVLSLSFYNGYAILALCLSIHYLLRSFTGLYPARGRCNGAKPDYSQIGPLLFEYEFCLGLYKCEGSE